MTVIKVENLSKQYRLGNVGLGSLSHDLNRWYQTSVRRRDDPYLKIGEVNDRSVKGNSEYVWALRDINFEVKQGEVLGIIGRNGAGKSTLLKILSRTTTPTTGQIKIKGRVASLLEVGTGFHPELTGRENIFLNGAILGMTKSEIKSKFDEIVDFAGVERYIDTPVKRYSSGMYVRLAFGVAAHLEPEILIVDEVLAVGDAEFQKKALGKMKDVSTKDGRTVLFVSHNMNAVRSLCDTGVFMENGKIVIVDDMNNAIKYYEKENDNATCWEGFDGDNTLKIFKTKIIEENNSGVFKTQSVLNVIMIIETMQDFSELVIGITIKSINGYPLATILYNDFNDYTKLEKGVYEVIFSIPPYSLAHGEYQLEFNVSVPFVRKISSEQIGLSFKMTADSSFGNKFFTDNNRSLNSIMRPNWFKSIQKIK
jgi:lipopolysaccharide transport system ATP-binding protein